MFIRRLEFPSRYKVVRECPEYKVEGSLIAVGTYLIGCYVEVTSPE